MPETGLVAELDSQARTTARLKKKILEEKCLFAVHACLSCVLALWFWPAARSADVGCPASQQDNIKLIWHPYSAQKSENPRDCGLAAEQLHFRVYCNHVAHQVIALPAKFAPFIFLSPTYKIKAFRTKIEVWMPRLCQSSIYWRALPCRELSFSK